MAAGPTTPESTTPEPTTPEFTTPEQPTMEEQTSTPDIGKLLPPYCQFSHSLFFL